MEGAKRVMLGEEKLFAFSGNHSLKTPLAYFRDPFTLDT